VSKEDGAVKWQQSENDCKQDAESEVKILRKKYPLYHIHGEAVPILKYAGRGKPSADTVPEVKGYKLDLVLEMNTKAVETMLTLNRKGRFILATNDLDATGYSDERMLSEYKSQKNVEGGFRFLKDPWFMVDSVFLKSPSRIESLMMVMMLCLRTQPFAGYSRSWKAKAWFVFMSREGIVQFESW
jgi:transposase